MPSCIKTNADGLSDKGRRLYVRITGALLTPHMKWPEALERYEMGQGNTLDDRIIGMLAKEIVQQIASKADEVCVSVDETDGTIAVQVEVASSDLDRVLGQNQITARSLGVIVGAVAKKMGKRCALQVRKSEAVESAVPTAPKGRRYD